MTAQKTKVNKLLLCKLSLKSQMEGLTLVSFDLWQHTLQNLQRLPVILCLNLYKLQEIWESRHVVNTCLSSYCLPCYVLYYITRFYTKVSACRLKGVCIVYFFGHKVVHVGWQLVLDKHKSMKAFYQKKSWYVMIYQLMENWQAMWDTLQISMRLAVSSISSRRESALAPAGVRLLGWLEDLHDCCHL